MASKKKGKPGYPCRHFGLSNGRGPAQSDLPKLLRRLARHIEEMEVKEDVLDVTIKSEFVGGREVWVATVYF